jgi:hypothetical protein
MSGPLEFDANGAEQLGAALRALTKITADTGCVFGGAYPIDISMPGPNVKGTLHAQWNADVGEYVIVDRSGD